MKPPEFDYAAPESLDEALALLASGRDAKVLAGGQSLIPLLNFRMAYPELLVDLRRIRGLDGIGSADGRLVLGAMVTQRDAEDSDVVSERCPLLAAALRHVAHPQIRSRGTVGGSVAHGDPAAEVPALLVALDGRVTVTGPGGERPIDAGDLYEGLLSTAVAEDEIVTSVELPAIGERSGTACVELARRAGDYALCGCLAQVGLGADGTVSSAAVGLFGIGDRPVRARGVEEALVGADGERDAVEAAAGRATEGVRLLAEDQLSADYRRHLATVVTQRAIEQAIEGVR